MTLDGVGVNLHLMIADPTRLFLRAWLIFLTLAAAYATSACQWPMSVHGLVFMVLFVQYRNEVTKLNQAATLSSLQWTVELGWHFKGQQSSLRLSKSSFLLRHFIWCEFVSSDQRVWCGLISRYSLPLHDYKRLRRHINHRHRIRERPTSIKSL